MEAFFLSVLKDAAVAVVAAVVLAAVKRLLPRLAWDKEAEAAPPRPKSFVLDVVWFVMRIGLIMTACWITVFCVLVERRVDSVLLSEARFVGRWLPSLRLTNDPFGSQFIELVLMLVVPFSVAERATSWLIETWGRTRGYVSEEFAGGARSVAMLVPALALAAHLYYVFSTASYGSAWVRTMVGAGVTLIVVMGWEKLRKAKRKG
jgi:hypothetical protein